MIESGSAHQVHHYALLFGMGADAVCPYMCYYALFKARDEGKLGMNYSNTELTQSVKNAFDYGVRKVMAKIGISTLQSYHGAQIFEALGVHQEIMDRAFTGTPSRIRCMYIHTYIPNTCHVRQVVCLIMIACQRHHLRHRRWRPRQVPRHGLPQRPRADGLPSQVWDRVPLLRGANRGHL